MTQHEAVKPKPAEVLEILRLTNRLHSTHDPTSRKQQLVEGFCALFAATSGECVLNYRRSRQDKIAIVSSATHCTTARFPAPTAPGKDASESATVQERTLHSALQFSEEAMHAELRLVRAGEKSRPFTQRDRELFELFHKEMRWVYQADLLLASNEVLSLPPRARQTLEHLLAGQSEKEIAVKLSVSKNTVHHYVKLIHRHFDVSSRSELLARWVRK